MNTTPVSFGDYEFLIQESKEATKGTEDESGEGRSEGGFRGSCWSHHEGRAMFPLLIHQYLIFMSWLNSLGLINKEDQHSNIRLFII